MVLDLVDSLGPSATKPGFGTKRVALLEPIPLFLHCNITSKNTTISRATITMPATEAPAPVITQKRGKDYRE